MVSLTVFWYTCRLNLSEVLPARMKIKSLCRAKWTLMMRMKETDISGQDPIYVLETRLRIINVMGAEEVVQA